jgi:hypothetical protein
VWKNDDFFNTVLSKSYKDGDDWKDTDQLGTGDLSTQPSCCKLPNN